jgi:hypothetical protein
VPAEYLTAKPGTKQAKTVDAFRKMVRGVRRDENEGLVLPIPVRPGHQAAALRLRADEFLWGSRQFDTNAIIQRYEQRILMSVLADFILVGHEGTWLVLHAHRQDRYLPGCPERDHQGHRGHPEPAPVPRLFEVNGWKLDELPKFEPSNIDPPDLNQLAQFISATAGAGMQWFPDPELEKFVRDIARLPEMTDETVEFKRSCSSSSRRWSLRRARCRCSACSRRPR